MASPFSRKQFGSSILILIAIAFSYYWQQSKRPVKEAFLASEVAEAELTNKGRILLINVDGDVKRRWPLPFSVHSVQLNLAQPYQIIAVEDGPSAAMVDARTRRKAQDLKAPEDLVFAGHAVFSQDGSQVYLTARHRTSQEGFILAYNTETLELISRAKSGGFLPHDIEFDYKSSNNLLIAHKGSEQQSSRLTWYIPETQKIEKSVDLPKGKQVTEIFQTFNNDLYVMGLKTFALFNRQKESFLQSNWSESRQGEIQNAYYDAAEQKVWLTLPEDDSVVVINPVTLDLIKEFKASRPRALIAIPPQNPNLLLVSVATHGSGVGTQRAYNLKTLEGSDEGVKHPRKFYAIHAFPLEVQIQDE